MIEVNKKIAEEHGLTSEEYDKICSLLKKNSKFNRTRNIFCYVERALLL